MVPDAQLKLFKRVEELFFRLGIRNLTMDDVARELGISKKTLYQHVESKDDLVKKVVAMGIEADCTDHESILAASTDAIDEMLLVAEHIVRQVRQVKPSLMFELQRHHPEAWALMDDFHSQSIRHWIRANIIRGIDEGLYRPDANPEIVASLYVAAAANILDERFFPHGKFAFEEVIRQFMVWHLAGVCSEKGRELLVNRLAEAALKPVN